MTEVRHTGSASEAAEHRYFYDLLATTEILREFRYGRLYDSMQRLRSLINYRTDGSAADLADLSDNDLLVRVDYTLRDDGRRTGADEFWYTVGSATQALPLEATQALPLEASYEFSYDNLGRLTDEVFDYCRTPAQLWSRLSPPETLKPE